MDQPFVFRFDPPLAGVAISARRVLIACIARRSTCQHPKSTYSLEQQLIDGQVEQLGTKTSKATVKQHLAAIRQLFYYLTTGAILDVNPAASVRGPRYVVKRGKTPVLSSEEARKLLDALESNTLIGLRDQALIGMMVYSFARVGATVTMKVGTTSAISVARSNCVVFKHKGVTICGTCSPVWIQHRPALTFDWHPKLG
jgi:site-specific recombinase XerD